MELPGAYNDETSAPRRFQDLEHERKQRNREYRVAARREKRNRKADEKKQRKLNALVLRRMTRNPEKYNKNAERNRLRAIEVERRKIQQEAVRQAQRLAAIHDDSGKTFNVDPVMALEDGSVVTKESLKRRQSNAPRNQGVEGESNANAQLDNDDLGKATHQDLSKSEKMTAPEAPHRSKSQMKKLAKFAPRPTPPKPHIPQGVRIPESEEDWLALWDLDDLEIERRITREKRRKAAARKALRVKQQSGKAERRMARDEKRRVYRDLKLEWRSIKEETDREKARLKALESREIKKISVHICNTERQRAMLCCTRLGLTMENTAAVQNVRPRALGMRGVEVDFDAIEKGPRENDITVKRRSRTNLGSVPNLSKTEYVPNTNKVDPGQVNDFIRLDVGNGEDFESLNYNHKTRRKLRRAIEHAEVEKELLVRRRALDYYRQQGLAVPAILHTAAKPASVQGQRILENGALETAKQERVRSRIDLAAFNEKMRVLRRQAKERAVYAGLRKHAEVTGRLRSTHELGGGQVESQKAGLFSTTNARTSSYQSAIDNVVSDSSEVSEDSDLVSNHDSV